MEISIRFPSGPFDFDEMTMQQMAVVGRISTRLSAYEYSCDDFIFSVVEHHPDFVRKHRLEPSFNSDEKRRSFILTALEKLDVLSGLRDGNGEIDVPTIGQTMEMVWHHRRNLTHGRLTGSRRKDQDLELSFQKWSKSDDEKRTYHRVTFSYDQPLLEAVLDHASYLQAMLTEAKQLVAGAQPND